MDKDLKLYEVAYLINPALSEDSARDLHRAIKNAATALGGIIDHDGEVIRRRLSYAIKKMREAYLAHFSFILPPEKTLELKKQIEKQDVLRSLMVETKRQPERQMPMRQARPLVSQEADKKEEMPFYSAATPIKSRQKTTVEQPTQPKPTGKALEEIDKKLEEILGK